VSGGRQQKKAFIFQDSGYLWGGKKKEKTGRKRRKRRMRMIH
jgi:hypothetical protein